MGKVKWTIDLLTLHLNILIKRMIMLPKTHIQWGNMKHFIFLKKDIPLVNRKYGV